MEGNFFNTDLSYGITVDKRNRVFKPTEGYRTTFYQSLPIIQDSSSILNGFDVNTYRGFSEDLIGSLKFSAKSIHGIDDDVRLSNRLFIGSKTPMEIAVSILAEIIFERDKQKDSA